MVIRSLPPPPPRASDSASLSTAIASVSLLIDKAPPLVIVKSHRGGSGGRDVRVGVAIELSTRFTRQICKLFSIVIVDRVQCHPYEVDVRDPP